MSTLEDSPQELICTKCGTSQIPATQFCTTCGSLLVDPKRKKELEDLHAYWYCKKDNVLMKETTPDHQFLISKEIDNSIQEAIENRKIRAEQKTLVKEIAQKVLEYEPKTQFPLLTRIRCPICMEDSLAPVYYQPKHEESIIPRSQIILPSQYGRTDLRGSPTTPIQVERLNPIDMVQNVFQILRQHPQILGIPFVIIIIELVLNIMLIPFHDLSSIVVLLFPDAYQEEGLIQASEVIIGISVDLLIEGVFITSLLVYFKSKLTRIDEEQISSPSILSQGIDIFPKILIIKLLMDGLNTAFLVVGLALLIFIMTISSYPMSPLFATLILFISLIVSSFPLVVAGMLLIVFSYAYPSIVMEKAGPIDSLVNSWDFVKKNLWPTLAIVFLFTYVPSLTLSFISPEILVLDIETIILRIFETGQLLCFLWGFETFRTMQKKSEVIIKTPSKLPDQRSPAYLYITQPYFYRSGDKAPLRGRLIALLIDSCIVGGLTYAICLGWLYQAGKDYIREGQSFGKGLMGLRVIDYNTGMPATVYQSFIRNCLCSCVDASCCCLAAVIDENGRRVGDHVAGTVVIIDQ